MSLLARVRDWVASLFGSDAADEAQPETAGVCAVCGTSVPAADETCPLCGSHDVAARDAADGDDATPVAAAGGDGEGGGGGEEADAEPTAGDAPGPARQAVEETTDDAVTRLQDVRGEGPSADDETERPDGG